MSELRDDMQHALGASYTIERELGGGGMSRVFLARETALGRQVVVKMLTPELAAGMSAERFTREINVAARLQQANIVPLLTTGEAQGVPWYSMPYVSGESLRAKLAQGRQVPLSEALHILRDVARALAFAHGAGVVHRDIKPENILLSGGAAVVTDFGIAKAVTVSRTQDGSTSALTQTGVAIGTPAYMAPEQVAGDPNTDHRADIYALGVVAWELIAGKHPFASRTSPTAMLGAHISEKPAMVTASRAEVSPGLAALVARCLEKDPGLRPQSADELLAALDQVGTTSGAHASTRAARVSPRVIVAGATALIIAVAGVWLATRGGKSSGESTGVQKSLAVLPFESVGGDTANVYFAEGIADELTTALAKVSGLRVAATSSAFSYRNKTTDPREVGKALNVGAVLQGRVQRDGGRMRVSVQLTNASDGILLWSNSYQREAKDVFMVQDELTRDIVAALRVTLAGGANVPNTRGSRDAVAHDLYLRGLFFLNARGPGVARSIPYFKQAIARDSSFAAAWAQLGTAYGFLPIFDTLPRDTLFRDARAAIDRALRIDSLTPEAHTASGLVAAMVGQWQAANASYERAIALDSNYTLTYRLAMSTLPMLARESDAQVASRILMERDPLSAVTAAVVAMTQLSFGHRDAALVSARRAVELDSTGAMPRAMLGVAELVNGHPDVALKFAKTAGHTPNTTPWIAWVYGAAGDKQAAADLVKGMQAQRDRNASADITIAFAALGGGDTTTALAALERAARTREAISFMAPFGMPVYDAIRGSPRFAAIVRAFGADPALFTRAAGADR